jgi:hypothetical protein
MNCSEMVMEEVSEAMMWKMLLVVMSIYSCLEEVERVVKMS